MYDFARGLAAGGGVVILFGAASTLVKQAVHGETERKRRAGVVGAIIATVCGLAILSYVWP